VWLVAGACLTGNWLFVAVSLSLSSVMLIFKRDSLARRAAWPAAGLWMLHVLQIDIMLRAAGVEVGLLLALARIPAVIFAGLLPISLFGLGTRDAALIWLFSDVAAPSVMAAVGLLTATRYLIPGAAGIVLLAAGGAVPGRADACASSSMG
jgi:hypothetical protein